MSRLFLNIAKKPIFTQVRFRRLKSKKREIDDLQWAERLIVKHNSDKSDSSREPETAEPAKLHMVYLVKSLKGRPYWEKDVAKCLHIDELNKIAVHKNMPKLNELLKSINHLIRVIPISFPYGLPESEEDYGHCYLRDNGEFVVQKRLNPLDVTPSDGDAPKKFTLDQETLKRANTLKLTNYTFGMEYFKAKYKYKFNQDGKEFRYKGNLNINSDRDWY